MLFRSEVDAAFSNLVWHHLPDHDADARETLRVLRPGGVAVVSDLHPHEHEWMRERMGDLRLGLKSEQVVGAMVRAGFVGLRVEELHDRHRVAAGDAGEAVDFPMFAVRGVKPPQRA